MSNPKRKNRYKTKKQTPVSKSISDRLPTGSRSRGRINTEGATGALPTGSRSRGRVYTDWKDIKWNTRGALVVTTLLVAPYLIAVIVTFLLGMTVISGMLIAIAVILGLIVALLRWINKAEL